jgi:TIR domain
VGYCVDGSDTVLPDYFISRTGVDAPIAAKVAQILEGVGHRVVLQQWDFANKNFMAEMDTALASGARVISILTPEYLSSDYCTAEWMHPLSGDPLNRRGRLIVLRVAPCEPKGLLRNIAYWDLVRLAGRSDGDALLADIVAAAVMPDAQRRDLPVSGYWRAAATINSAEVRRTPHFTGRASELYDIDFALQEGSNAALSQAATIRGMGGAGKSTLAREYAFQVLETDAYAGIWWLDAEKDPDTLSWSKLVQDLVALGDKFQPGLANARDPAAAASWTLDQIAKGGFDCRATIKVRLSVNQDETARCVG